jgi:hypothetical protein
MARFSRPQDVAWRTGIDRIQARHGAEIPLACQTIPLPVWKRLVEEVSNRVGATAAHAGNSRNQPKVMALTPVSNASGGYTIKPPCLSGAKLP